MHTAVAEPNVNETLPQQAECCCDRNGVAESTSSWTIIPKIPRLRKSPSSLVPGMVPSKCSLRHKPRGCCDIGGRQPARRRIAPLTEQLRIVDHQTVPVGVIVTSPSAWTPKAQMKERTRTWRHTMKGLHEGHRRTKRSEPASWLELDREHLRWARGSSRQQGMWNSAAEPQVVLAPRIPAQEPQ